jgi:glycosyltransferase involved in cell wall biosynthesis
MDTEAYDLASVLRRGLTTDIPVTTFDDGTFALFRRHPDADISLAAIPARDLDLWVRRQGAGCRAASICCVSTSWAGASIVEDYAVPADQVKVVGMGHRPRSADSSVRDWSSPRFLFVGVEWDRKNGAAVLAAFHSVRQSYPDATLDLVGEHELVTDQGVTDHGLLRRDDPQAQRLLDSLFAKATAFVLPSRFDPSPIAYLEAASAGLPVVATTEGGAGELLGDGAITVHPDDQEALVAGMLRLADPEQAQRLGAEAQRRAEQSSWTKVTERILEHLARVSQC